MSDHLRAPNSHKARLALLAAHVEQLADAHGVGVVWQAAVSRGGRATRVRHRQAKRRRAWITVRPVKTQWTYLIALHELGHLVGRGRSAPRLEAEANAWKWALANTAEEPTPANRRRIVKALESYLRWAELRQHRQVPPRIPPRDHDFWRLLNLA